MEIWTGLDNGAPPVAVTGSGAPAPAGTTVLGCPVAVGLLLPRHRQPGTLLPLPAATGAAAALPHPEQVWPRRVCRGAGGSCIGQEPLAAPLPLQPHSSRLSSRLSLRTCFSLFVSCFKVILKWADQPGRSVIRTSLSTG